MQRRTQQLLSTALAIVMAAGCSETTDPATDQTPAVTISFASTSMSVPRGQSQSFPITITRRGGFTGSVSIAVTGLPQDLAAGCSPSPVLGSTSTLTIAPGPSQALGAFTATVRATGSGVVAQTVLLTITVTN
jgi:hypothetical protein